MYIHIQYQIKVKGDKMQRILISVPSDAIQRIDALKKIHKTSRTQIIRQAVEDYLDKNAISQHDDAFGLWQNNQIDGLVYQQLIREEWS